MKYRCLMQIIHRFQGKDLSDMSEDEREQLEEHRLVFRDFQFKF